MIYKYWVEDMEDLREFEMGGDSSEEYRRGYLAEIAAKAYWLWLCNKCNNWGQNEAFVFHIFREDGYFLGRFNVECEYVPTFSAIEEPALSSDEV